ncbi:protein kinase domain-containing protein [Cryptosporidium serpentis]
MPNNSYNTNNSREIQSKDDSKIENFKVGEKVGRYIKIREIGSGSYGKAILVKDIYKGKEYVMKVINISKLSPSERKDAINEVKLLNSVRHPCIVCFRESFVEAGLLNIVMEYAERGDLFRRINAQKQLKRGFLERQIVRWLTQALLGLAHLHSRKILHRDIKSQNMFISYYGLKIGDFGIAKTLENTGAFAKTTIGTPYYLSPEICSSKPYSWSSDIWALGCVAYEMCSLRVPFDAPNLKMLVEKITNGIIAPISNIYSSGLQNVIMDMLITDSKLRPTASELLQYSRIEAELKLMKREAISICRNKSSNSAAVSFAASIIEAISAVQVCYYGSSPTLSICSTVCSPIFEDNLVSNQLGFNIGGRTASRIEEVEDGVNLIKSGKYYTQYSEEAESEINHSEYNEQETILDREKMSNIESVGSEQSTDVQIYVSSITNSAKDPKSVYLKPISILLDKSSSKNKSIQAFSFRVNMPCN